MLLFFTANETSCTSVIRLIVHPLSLSLYRYFLYEAYNYESWQNNTVGRVEKRPSNRIITVAIVVATVGKKCKAVAKSYLC